MKIKRQSLIDIEALIERSFDVNITVQQLNVKRHKVMCWGIPKYNNFKDGMLLFEVTGLKFQGWVVITLSWMDTYTVRYYNFSMDKEILEMDTDVYCDDLTDIIDAKIEHDEN
jgi:hypothetical protein